MKSIYTAVLITMTFCLYSCGSAGEKAEALADKAEQELQDVHDQVEEHHESEVEINEAGGYGEVITAEGAMSVDELITALASNEEVSAKVSGKVTEACQMAGCWMKMPYGEGDEMRVTFKDYGFFVPKDLPGSEVVVSGTASKKEMTVAMLQHYAEDAGKSAEEIAAITEPAYEISFVADGVIPVSGE